MADALPSRKQLSKRGGQRQDFRWVHVHNPDELEAFYRAILPNLITEARYYGYALGVHGSLRRDLDLIAVPWTEEHADKDDLARGLQEAACGLWEEKYYWGPKPCGRIAASFPICWTERSDAFPRETNLGHIDLSIMPARDTPSETATITPTLGAWLLEFVDKQMARMVIANQCAEYAIMARHRNALDNALKSAAPQDMARGFQPDDTMRAEVARIINEEPQIASLLYDIDLLPEQIKDERRYNYMLAVIGHMRQAIKKAPQVPDGAGLKEGVTPTPSPAVAADDLEAAIQDACDRESLHDLAVIARGLAAAQTAHAEHVRILELSCAAPSETADSGFTPIAELSEADRSTATDTEHK